MVCHVTQYGSKTNFIPVTNDNSSRSRTYYDATTRLY
ncbi:ABC transporter family protein, partial [Vibrio parahaemolyticus VP-48]